MIIVITPEAPVSKETEIINQLFHEGLDLLHIRKPMFSNEEMKSFLNGIDEEFYSQLVVHGFYDMRKEYSISRLHFREADRLEEWHKVFADGTIISTSVHDIEGFNALEKEWEYALISPFFPSISKKGYGEQSTIMEDVKDRNNQKVKLIALGGINQDNISKVFERGADGAALLGGIWESSEPINSFRKCRKTILSS
ncbi:thiamine phosphate synthase [Chryseobacterium shigense]|uniref:Thiamine-phosphate pyrophosphorylase n=1 Tax=Chryseobacterium shigense TaxID=297244 RepID=A0A1N7J719_9FLAO|nr:thiamine phosphate synthase [Chryseobacterium shigense]PQA93575.1 thiamine phosphate synthase [Chryseobacterium shigense]SIS45109.1 thiamine-phosphate pyrophosphorylase [Chryseobacterium shigense]